MLYSNDDMDLTNEKSFLTGLNTSQIVKSDTKKSIVFKIEDVDPPLSENGQSIPLPDNSNYSRVIDNIQETLKKVNPKFTNPSIVHIWRSHFTTPACTSILSDMFWFSLVKIDKRAGFKEYKKNLLERISHNYIQVFVNVPMDHKEIFFENFFDAIAQGVFYSMFFSYPKSRSRLNSEDFKQKLYELISKHITGLTVKNQGYNHWILDLGAGNVLDKPQSFSQNAGEKLPLIKLKGKTRRTMQPMRYSPFVSRYLHAKRYEAINSVPTWNMRYTMRNLEKEKQVEEKYTYYKKLAIDTERRAKDRDVQFQEVSSKIDEEIKEEHREYRKFVNKINKQTKDIIKEGASEYANKLISLEDLQKKENKSGYIPLL
jgi:hypothetical protein